MRRIVFRLGLFEDGRDRSYSERALAVLVCALVDANAIFLRAHPDTPSLHTSGVRFARESSRCGTADEWKGIEAALADGVADAVTLASWRCAERVVAGERARPVVRWHELEGRRCYDIILVGSDGSIEEPAALFAGAGDVDPCTAHLSDPSSIVALRLRLFHGERERAYSERVLATLLAALTAANVAYLRTYAAPSLYRAGVRYRAERFPSEEWKGIAAVLADGHADCEDLASYRSAELIVRGEAAHPMFRWRRVGRLSVYHILVRHADGAIEDPSLLLGMGRGRASLAELMGGSSAPARRAAAPSHARGRRA